MKHNNYYLNLTLICPLSEQKKEKDLHQSFVVNHARISGKSILFIILHISGTTKKYHNYLNVSCNSQWIVPSIEPGSKKQLRVPTSEADIN